MHQVREEDLKVLNKQRHAFILLISKDGPWRYNNVSGHIIDILVDYDEGVMTMARRHRALTQISMTPSYYVFVF